MLAGFPLLVTFILGSFAENPAFDHQNETYTAHFTPVKPSPTGLYVTPYFSPDHSIQTQVYLLQNATKSIDISAPGWDAWSDCDSSSSCAGCTPTETRDDAFPLFGVVLNAVHNGIAVRILTNDYEESDCSGKISALSFLALNGVQVRYYTTTTFDHQKYMCVDGVIVSISSINFSETSYENNREAGIIFSGATTSIAAFTSSVFEADWEQAFDYKVNQTYSSSEMDIILNKAAIKIVVPAAPNYPGSYVTPEPTPIELKSSDGDLLLYTSPDSARTELLDELSAVATSLDVMIYQVTDEGLCAEILNLHTKGVNVSLLVSQCIDSYTDTELAEQCYKNLTSAGFTNIYKTPSYYEMSHQKFWIIDGKRVGLATGNWSPEDFQPGTVFPPYGQKGWQETNRDFTLALTDPSVVTVFQNVFDNDKQRGTTWASDPVLKCSFSRAL